MTASIIIPTLKRPEFLRGCLSAVARQTVLPSHVYVGIKAEDYESAAAACEFQSSIPVVLVKAMGLGVIGSMSACLERTTEEAVAILDDDAFPRADWLARILATFEQSEEILGVGGLDLQEKPDHSSTNLNLPVGTMAWYGRLHGNHHLGRGEARPVLVLKGCNCAYRGSFLRKVGFDHQLRGSGAQVGWEISLGFDALGSRGRLVFDPDIIVDHKIAPRHDGDTIHRGRYNQEAAFDIAYNFFSTVFRKAPLKVGVRLLFWEGLVGSRINPGILRIADVRIGPLSDRLARIKTTVLALSISVRLALGRGKGWNG